MCIEDVRLGRSTTAVSRSITIGNASTLLVPPAPKRTALLIGRPVFAGGATRVTLRWNESVTDGNGLIVDATSDNLLLDVQHHGAMLTAPIFAITDAGTAVVTFTSVFLEKE